MSPDEFVDLIEAESALFRSALTSIDLSWPVPSCPEWTGADLAWHLGEVHHFWRFVVEHRPEPPESYSDPERPGDEDLLAFAEEQANGLVAALRAASPDDRCWSWAEGGESVGWTMRRQAHEALIHRVDAQLVAGLEVSQPDTAFAADGVDELVNVFLGGLPPWASFEPDGEQRIALQATDTGDRWTLELGRFSGTSPNSGRSYDEPDARPIDAVEVAATVRGPAWAIDLWMWGRAGVDALERTGAPDLPDRLREIMVTSTQWPSSLPSLTVVRPGNGRPCCVRARPAAGPARSGRARRGWVPAPGAV